MYLKILQETHQEMR